MPLPTARDNVRAYNSVYVIDHDGTDPVGLRQGASRSVRGISAVPATLEKLGLMQLTKVQGGFLAGDRHRHLCDPARAALAAADLLRDRLSRRSRAGRRTAGLAAQSSRMTAGSASAPAPISIFQQARVRAIEEGLAAGARRQYRHFGHCRSARPHREVAAAWHRRRDRWPITAADRCNILCQIRETA